jgi:hypothetical protein
LRPMAGTGRRATGLLPCWLTGLVG